MNDLISRQAAISEIKKLYVKNPKTQDEYAYNDALDLADEMINDLPSVSLQEILSEEASSNKNRSD